MSYHGWREKQCMGARKQQTKIHTEIRRERGSIMLFLTHGETGM